MKTSVIYDRDLGRVRRWVLLAAFGNLGFGVRSAAEGSWYVVLVAGLWVFCCWVWLGLIRTQQSTRDMGRSIEAGLHGVYRDMQTGEFL